MILFSLIKMIQHLCDSFFPNNKSWWQVISIHNFWHTWVFDRPLLKSTSNSSIKSDTINLKGLIVLLIYRMISEEDWNENKIKKIYAPNELEAEGFIHFSFKNQLINVANAIYKEYKKLIVLEVETEKLNCSEALRIEDLYNYGVDYPHLYHALNTSAIISQFVMINSDSGFKLVV